MLSNSQIKKQKALDHNKAYSMLSDSEKILTRNVIKAANASQRHSNLDHTSANSSPKLDLRKKQIAENKNKLIMKGRDKINALMSRAGIVSSL